MSTKRVTPDQTEAARIEAYLKREGFQPLTPEEQIALEHAGLLGMPTE
jgi:hypothetical protein